MNLPNHKLEEKIHQLIEDNTKLTLKVNSLTGALEEHKIDKKILEKQLNKEKEINIVIRDCIFRFAEENDFNGLIETCVKYLNHYFKPNILTFYMDGRYMTGDDSTPKFEHVFEYPLVEGLEPTDSHSLTELMLRMTTSPQTFKQLSSFDLRLLKEKRTKSAMIFKIQYSAKIFGFVLLEYTEDIILDFGNFLNVIIELFANSYSMLIINRLLLERYGNAITEAYLDLKTGIANSRKFQEDIHSLTDDTYSLVSMDIDVFKDVNDNYGHDAGDIVLEYVGQTLNTYMEKLGGKGYREGGDEFFGISFKPLAKTEQVVKEMLETIKNKQFTDSRGNTFTITNSVGIYERKEREECEVVKKKVDILLYRSKENGRAQVTVDQDVRI